MMTEHKHKTHSVDKDDIPKAEDPKKSKRSLLFIIIGLAIIILVIGAILILSRYVFPNEDIVEYNHYVFQRFEGNKWMTQQLVRGQIYNIPFYNNPREVLDIPVDPKSVIAIRTFRESVNGTVYITVDPYESSKVVLANVEYARILGNAYNIYNMDVKSAISESVNGSGINVITCKNQSRDVFVIYQTVSDKNLISVKGNCITLESVNANESVRVADAFAFRLLNIIKDDNSTLSK